MSFARRPLRRINRGTKVDVDTVPAPVRGWNARDDLGNMKRDEAIILDNYYPGTTDCELRLGFAEHASNMGGDVETLMSYASGSTTKLLAAANNHVFDCTAAGSASALGSGYSNDRWQWVNMNDTLLAVNGEDAPKKYDGSWADATVSGSGLTTTELIHVNVFKERLFFIETASANVWYGAANAIAGALTLLDMSAHAPNGGYLMAMGTWTRDGGAGLDDYAVFIYSSGDVAVFQGTDPSSANTWALVGKFRLGAPIGRRCLYKVGADLVVITVDGYVPLSEALLADRTSEAVAISDKIRGAVREAVRSYKSYFGWEAILYPKGGYGLFNVPVSNDVFHQHVVNTTTGAWCRFIGQNAFCWALYNDDLYFGGASGKVYKADTGVSDDGAAIIGEMKWSFRYFGGRGTQKQFLQIRPIIAADGDLPLAIGFDVDFSETPVTDVQPSSVTAEGPAWDEEAWDTVAWASPALPIRDWRGVAGVGFCAAAHLKTSTTAQTVRIHSCDYRFQTGLGI